MIHLTKPEKFLFLEIIDREVNSFLLQLRDVLSEKKHATNIHITLKGPQTSFALKNNIKQYKNDHPEIDINGVGRFDNELSHVVFFRVACGDLKKYNLWRKPDYKGGYNPHITIYEGVNREIADVIYKYLLKCEIDLTVRHYEFTEYTRKQMTLQYHSIKSYLKNASLQSYYSKIIEGARIVIAENSISLTRQIHSDN